MPPVDTLFQALSSAGSAWEQTIDRVSWYHGLIFAAYLGAAWLCLLNGHVAKEEREAHTLWYAAAILLCLLGVNAVLHMDSFLTHVLRELAILAGWYAKRRLVQYLMICTFALMVLLAARWLHTAFFACNVPANTVAWGLAAMLMLVAVRTVSAHGTDVVINLRLSGISLGRLVEFAAIGLVVHGALRCLQLR
jgi:hypothetical protein